MRAFVSGAAAESDAGAPQGLSNAPGRTRPLLRIEGDPGRIPVARGALKLIPELAQTTWFGFVNADPTSADDIRRRLPLVFNMDGDFYAGFALKILMARWGVQENDVVVRLGEFISLP